MSNLTAAHLRGVAGCGGSALLEGSGQLAQGGHGEALTESIIMLHIHLQCMGTVRTLTRMQDKKQRRMVFLTALAAGQCSLQVCCWA